MKESGFLSQAALCLSAKSRFADYDTRVSDCIDSFWISEVFTFIEKHSICTEMN